MITPKVKPWATSAEATAFRLIDNKLREIATELLLTYASPMDAEHLYRLLIPRQDYEIMEQASRRMPKRAGYSTSDNIMLVTQTTSTFQSKMEFNIYYDTGRTQWLWPADLNWITPSSELGRLLLPLIDIAIQAQTTIRLFDLFIHNVRNRALIVHMLPWLRLLIPKIDTRFTETQVKYVLRKYQEFSEPQYIPGVSSWFASVCAYGTELISLHTVVMKDALKVQNHRQGTTIIPVLRDDLIEDGLEQHFNEIVWDAPKPTLEVKE